MAQAINVSEFRIPFDKQKEYENLLGPINHLIDGESGITASCVWKDTQDRDSFVRLTCFDSLENMDQFYDKIQRSPELLKSIEQHGIAPNVTRLSVEWAHRFHPDTIRTHELMSLSHRIMDPGYGPEWVEKLQNNLTEVSILPGYEGAIIGVNHEVAEEVFGLAFWQTEESFRQSVPSNPSYPIKLYSLYR